MLRGHWMLLGLAMAAALALSASAAVAADGGKAEAKPKVELPEAAAKALAAICPGAKVVKVDMEKDGGIAVYDIEFTVGDTAMEAEVTGDGAVLEVSAVVQMKDVPEAAAKAIQKAAEGATVKQVERGEIRAEIKKAADGTGSVVKLDKRITFEAELVKGDQEGEIQVAADGTVIEELKWKAKRAKEKD